MRRQRAVSFLARPVAAKVPHVALAFWVVKLLTTGMGEAMSDYVASLPALLAVGAVVVLLAGFIALFCAQMAAESYHPVRYWCTVAMVAIFGTMAADVLHVVLGNVVTTVLYAAAVGAVLWLWRRTEGSISIHSITTRRRELYYWATVAATFALGTAAGDLAAETLGLGYLDSAIAFGVMMVALLLAWRVLHVGAVPVFWTAYAITRPLGASVADWLGKPASKGHGLGWGDGPVSAGALAIFAVLLAWLAFTGHDRPRVDELD